MNIKKLKRGFTLIELLAAISIMALLLTVAVPSFFSSMQNNRLVSLSNELISLLHLARSEAIKRGVPVSICPASDDTFTACGTNWNAGWLVFVNPDGNGSFSNNSTETLIRAQQINGTGFNFTTTPNRNIATYNAQGYAEAGTGNLSFNLTADGCTTDSARRITISITGRISSLRTNC